MKFRGISLIETLISLTIVGIAMIALLPVVTIRKEGSDPSIGNRYWKKDANDAFYYIDNKKVSIGQLKDTEQKLLVINQGFGTQNILPFLVSPTDDTGYFRWNNIWMSKIGDDGLFLSSGVEDSLGYGAMSRNIYFDNNNFILENFSDTDTDTDFDTYAEFAVTNPPSKSGIRSSTSYYSLINNNNEYMVVDATNNVIGIGKNAARFYNGEGEDFIGIFNNNSIAMKGEDGNIAPNIIDSEDSEDSDGGFVIGIAKGKAPTDSDATGFVIHGIRNTSDTSGGASQITINANVDAGTYKAGAVILPSDSRLKDILYDYTRGLDEVLKIKPVEFTYKKDEKQKHHIGVIAQDLKQILPEAVSINTKTGYLMVKQEPIFYALLNSIKKLHEKNLSLKEENDKLEKKLTQLKSIKARLEKDNGGNSDAK